LNHCWAADVVDYHVRFREKTGGNVFVGLLDTPFFPVQTWAYMVRFASSLIESRDSISLSYRGDVELSRIRYLSPIGEMWNCLSPRGWTRKCERAWQTAPSA
jgi:hypothetical protein